MDNNYMVRGYHGTGKWYTTNGEYIPKPNMPRMDEGWLGGEFYVTEDLPTARDFYMNGINRGKNPALLNKDVIGFDLNPKEFIDLDKPLSKQSQIIQDAVSQYKINNPNWAIEDNLFFNKDGTVKPLPKLSSPQWNAWIDQLKPYGVKGWHDNINYTGDESTYVFRNIKDVPNGISLKQGTDVIPEFPDLVLEENLKKPPTKEQAAIMKNALKDINLSIPASNINKTVPKVKPNIKIQPKSLSLGSVAKGLLSPSNIVKGIVSPANIALMGAINYLEGAPASANQKGNIGVIYQNNDYTKPIYYNKETGKLLN